MRCVGGVALVLALVAASGAGSCRGRGAGPAVGELAPDFVLPRLDGGVQKLSNHRGKVVVVNMWATWCLPCIEEMPVLDRIARTYADRGLVVLGLAGDDDPERVRAFLDENPVSFDVLLDVGGEVGTRYGITGYPETFVVDREGRIRDKIVGPLPVAGEGPSPELKTKLEAWLGG